MNLVSKRILGFAEDDNYDGINELLSKHGVKWLEGECQIDWWIVGDDVLCRKSTTQIHFAGHLSQKPYFKRPEHTTEVADPTVAS